MGPGVALRVRIQAPPRASQQSLSAVVILNVGGQNAYAKEETEGVDEQFLRSARNRA